MSTSLMILTLSIILSVIIIIIIFWFISKGNNSKVDKNQLIRENPKQSEPLFKTNNYSDNNKTSLINVMPKKYKPRRSSKNIELQFENSKKTGILQLSKNNLNEFPVHILELSNKLRSLDLSNNNLQTISETIGELSRLKRSLLNNNRLNDLPHGIGKLKKLENLSVHINKIKELPQCVSNLSNLRILLLSHNELNIFPIVLCDLKNIHFIDLSDNQLIEIPDEIQYMNALELNVSQNQISIVSPLITQCKRLKVLRLNNNRLERTAITRKILAESQISLLTVEGNLFDDKTFRNLDGYESYIERRVATKNKINNI